MFEPFQLEKCDAFPSPEEHKRQVIASRAKKTKSRIEVRRAKSEAHLFDIMPAPLDTGAAFHVISGGDVDSLSFLARVLDEAPMDYTLMSTWCMALPDVEQVAKWLESGRIGRFDAYAGEIFPNQYPDVHRRLCDVLRAHGGRVAIFRNHAKVYAGTGQAFDFAISSSANVNTNPRTENTVLTFGREIFDFYKTFFDGIHSFNRDFDGWAPWLVKLGDRHSVRQSPRPVEQARYLGVKQLSASVQGDGTLLDGEWRPSGDGSVDE